MIQRRSFLAGLGAVAAVPLVSPEAFAIPGLDLSDRWIAFADLMSDTIFWRYDVLIGGARLNHPGKGAWKLAPDTQAMVRAHYPDEFAAMMRRVSKAKAGTQLHMDGPLRDHRSSDHDEVELSASLAEFRQCLKYA